MLSLSKVLTKFTDFAAKVDDDCGDVIMFRGLPSQGGFMPRGVISTKVLKRGVDIDKLAQLLYERDVKPYVEQPRRSLRTMKIFLDQDLKLTYEAVLWLRRRRSGNSTPEEEEAFQRNPQNVPDVVKNWGPTMQLDKWEVLLDFDDVFNALLLRYPGDAANRYNKVIHISSILHLFFEFEQEGRLRGYDQYISSVLKQRETDKDFQPGKMTEEQIRNYVPWVDEGKEKGIRDEAVRIFKKRRSKFSVEEKAILGLYTLLPPRRTVYGTLKLSRDWGQVQRNVLLAQRQLMLRNRRGLYNWLFVGSADNGGEKKDEKDDEQEEKDGSDVIVRIVLLDYKTVESFGPYMYELGKGIYARYRLVGNKFQAFEPEVEETIAPNRLFFKGQGTRDAMLKALLLRHVSGKRSGSFVWSKQRRFGSDLVTPIFEKLTTKSMINTRMLRHIYVTHVYNKNLAPSVNDRNIVGQLLGHNVRQLEKYYFDLEKYGWISKKNKRKKRKR